MKCFAKDQLGTRLSEEQRSVQTIGFDFRRIERARHEQPLRAAIGTHEAHVLVRQGAQVEGAGRRPTLQS